MCILCVIDGEILSNSLCAPFQFELQLNDNQFYNEFIWISNEELKWLNLDVVNTWY